MENNRSIEELVLEYLNRGGKIKKIPIGKTSESDENLGIISNDMPDSFVSPEFLLKEDIKILV